MSYFSRHLFFCVNAREGGDSCCQQFDAESACAYVKQKARELGIHAPGKMRINRAGCLGRCELGPVIAVYPEGVWYTYVDHEDLDEIIERHLIGGEVVERLVVDRKEY